MKRVCAAFAAIFSLLALAYALGLRVNFTASMPRGLYILSSGAPVRGDMAAFCLDAWADPWLSLAKERGYLGPGLCPGNVQPLLKRIAAVSGDEVEVVPLGIVVATDGGMRFWRALLRNKDAKGRDLPESALRSGIVPQDLTLVLADHPGSFDGRFFGLVPLASLQRVEPIFTF